MSGAKVGKTGSATLKALIPQAGTGSDSGNGLNPLAARFPEVVGEQQSWAHLYGSAKALALGAAARRAARPVVIIAQDTRRANRLQEQLCFYHAGAQGFVIRGFPGWEVLPYDHFSPYHDIVSERLATLSILPGMQRGVVVVSVQTLMQRLAPPSYIRSNSLVLEAGQAIDREAFRKELEAAGYRCVPEVEEHGDFAARGSLLDIFPMGGEVPYRIDLLDDEIDSIRAFDPETQRSQELVPRVCVLPAHEFPLTKEGITRFRAAWRVRFSGRPMDAPVYRDVSAALAPAGVESYLPLFFEQTATLFDYLSEDAVMVLDEGVEPAMERFWQEIQARYGSRCHDPERPLLEPHALFSSPDELLPRIGQHPVVRLSGVQENSAHQVFSTRLPPQIPVDARAQDPLTVLKRFLDTYSGRVLLVAETKGRRETLLELLSRHGLRPQPVQGWHEFLTQDPRLCVTVMPLDEGALVEQPTLAVITEAQLFGDRAAQRRRRRRGREPEALLRDLTALHPGAPVVHEEHGVGRYGGLVSLETGGLLGEYLQLEYADGDKLYLPISSLHLLTRYSGVDPDHAPLHKLGSGQWQRARERAAKRIRDVAAELLEIHSRRAARIGNSFFIDPDAYASFVQGFPFEETPDQEATIAAVLQDMQVEAPMDRLVCGDTGFGKTEVALRAAFVVINNGQQAAVLVPTTLLAQQHLQTFKDRFSDWPVRVEQLSRFLN
ncbi:MAG: CarD family transcriptional regulator, partial [Gammaproteobacteria bacterium]